MEFQTKTNDHYGNALKTFHVIRNKKIACLPLTVINGKSQSLVRGSGLSDDNTFCVAVCACTDIHLHNIYGPAVPTVLQMRQNSSSHGGPGPERTTGKNVSNTEFFFCLGDAQSEYIQGMCGCEHMWVCALYLWVCQTGVVGFEVVDDALACTGQGDTAHQEHKQHDVWEGGCQVHHLEST